MFYNHGEMLWLGSYTGGAEKRILVSANGTLQVVKWNNVFWERRGKQFPESTLSTNKTG